MYGDHRLAITMGYDDDEDVRDVRPSRVEVGDGSEKGVHGRGTGILRRVSRVWRGNRSNEAQNWLVRAIALR